MTEPLPAVYRHCTDVYNEMSKEASPVETEGVRLMVWEGFFVQLIRDQLGLSTPYYTAIRGHLIRMGCIKQLRRGGGSSPSQWELLRAPSEELWYNKKHPKNRQTSKLETIEGQMKDLANRQSDLEKTVMDLISFLNTQNNMVKEANGG